MRRQLMILVALAAALAPAVLAERAWAPRECGGCGQWAGFARSAVIGPDYTPPVSLEILSQQGRRFEGEFAGLGGPDTKTAVEGTLSESGQLSLVGRGEQGGVIVINGKATALPNPSEGGVVGPNYFQGRYELRMADGTRDRGRLVAVHQVPDPRAPSIAGSWAGTAQGVGNPNDGPVAALFTQTADGILAGRLSLDTGERSASFELVGHAAALEGGGVGVALVGGGDDGMIIINGFGDGSLRELSLSYRWIGGPGGFEAAEEGSIIIIGGSPA
jgi:hypothetical protein